MVKTLQYGLTSTTERVEPNDYLTIVIKVPAPEPRCREQNATTIRKGRDTQLSGTKCRRATSAVAVVDRQQRVKSMQPIVRRRQVELSLHNVTLTAQIIYQHSQQLCLHPQQCGMTSDHSATNTQSHAHQRLKNST